MVEQNRGFLLKEMIALQASFPEEGRWIADTGSLFVSPADGQYSNFRDDCAYDLLVQPHVFGLTRELAIKRMSWTTPLFLYEEPHLGFSPSEQRLLIAALQGGTDEELSDELAISVSAVKKAWSSIYDRAKAHLPESICGHDDMIERGNGERGKQKKQRLIGYLRGHPEELRPYSRRSQVGQSG